VDAEEIPTGTHHTAVRITEEGLSEFWMRGPEARRHQQLD
jgi:hypothetical protein